MNWKHYLINLLNAGASGAATLILSNGFGVDWKTSAKIAGGAALVSALKWYLQHQPPDVDSK